LGSILSVASVTIANGGDNFAVYVPLFARGSAAATLVTCGVFAVLVAIWCAAARWLVNHRRLGTLVSDWGYRSLPFVLLGLGTYILLRSGALQALVL
jgi:cadmium resistance protein CadD (predicted permease)